MAFPMCVLASYLHQNVLLSLGQCSLNNEIIFYTPVFSSDVPASFACLQLSCPPVCVCVSSKRLGTLHGGMCSLMDAVPQRRMVGPTVMSWMAGLPGYSLLL